jgi:predicted transglutaminase-like cysteine proteinase
MLGYFARIVPFSMLRRRVPSLFAIALGLIMAEAVDSRICEDGEERSGACVLRTAQTDPAPYVIGAFGGQQFPAPHGELWEKWRKVRAEIEADRSLIERCRNLADECPWTAVLSYVGIVDEAKRQRGMARLNYVNRALNSSIRYVEDIDEFDMADVWLSPIASIEAGRGDCEDYAIAKYSVLRDAGVPAEDRQLVLVTDIIKKREHMVVGVRHERRWLILDNQSQSLREDSDLPHYLPLFALDHRGVRQYGKPAPQDGFRIRDLVSACSGAFA